MNRPASKDTINLRGSCTKSQYDGCYGLIKNTHSTIVEREIYERQRENEDDAEDGGGFLSARQIKRACTRVSVNWTVQRRVKRQIPTGVNYDETKVNTCPDDVSFRRSLTGAATASLARRVSGIFCHDINCQS